MKICVYISGLQLKHIHSAAYLLQFKYMNMVK